MQWDVTIVEQMCLTVLEAMLLREFYSEIEFLPRSKHTAFLDDWLTVYRSITLVDIQLDAQNSDLFTYNTFTKILYMFRALPCSSSGVLRRNYDADLLKTSRVMLETCRGF